MERKYYIYRYTNILNGMKYDGNTSLTQSRRAGKDGKNYIKMCRRFGEAILEFGWPNFKYEVLEDGLTKEEALEREKYWIEHDDCVWPKGYNLEAGSKIGHSVNDETKKIMSENRKGQKGYPHSYVTDNQKRYYAEISKPVREFTKEGQLYGEYSSIAEASRKTGISAGSISSCCRGITKTAGKHLWSFEEFH